MSNLLMQREVAKIFGVCRRTVGRWTASGQLACVCPGGIQRYRQEDVDAFIQANLKAVENMSA